MPDNVLWAPKQYLSNMGYNASGTILIEDKLWLPTEREMHGYKNYSIAEYETAANQARLEYYNTDKSRDKGAPWILASPAVADLATKPGRDCMVNGGRPTHTIGNGDYGCVPAFCIK